MITVWKAFLLFVVLVSSNNAADSTDSIDAFVQNEETENTTCQDGACDAKNHSATSTTSNNDNDNNRNNGKQHYHASSTVTASDTETTAVKHIESYWGVPQACPSPYDEEHVKFIVHRTDYYMRNEVYQDPDLSDVVDMCVNRHELCSFWAFHGHCETNTQVSSMCGPACQSCDDLLDDDDDEEYEDEDEYEYDDDEEEMDTYQQEHSSPGQPGTEELRQTPYKGLPQRIGWEYRHYLNSLLEETENYMKNIVAVGEKYKDIDCQNTHELCTFWALMGQCQENPNYMLINCAPVCQTCQYADYTTKELVREISTMSQSPSPVEKTVTLESTIQDFKRLNIKFRLHEPAPWSSSSQSRKAIRNWVDAKDRPTNVQRRQVYQPQFHNQDF